MRRSGRLRAPGPLAWYGGSWAYSEPAPPAPDPERKKTFRASDFGPQRPPGEGHGVILGRFLPPHLGHQYLIDFARAFTAELTLFLRISDDDPIPGDVRLGWLRELYPESVVPVWKAPPAPSGYPGFDDPAGDAWADIVRRAVPRVEYVFSSDDLLPVFTSALGARAIRVDAKRQAVPVSGTMIRDDPWGHWDFLPPCVRPYYLRRVCVIGPEATGKTTLARLLAEKYETAWVGEQARAVCGGRPWEPELTQVIARSQLAAEDALARRARRVLFCDTDLLSVRLWSERLFGLAPDWVREQADARACDLYLVTDLTSPGPVEPGGTTGPAVEPEQRQGFLQRCQEELHRLGRPFVVLTGTWDERFAQACAAVGALRAR